MINIPRTLSIAGVQFCRRAVRRKKMRAPLLGLPKSIYQIGNERWRNLYSVFEGCSLFIFLKHGRKRSTSRGLKHHTYGLAARSSTTVRQRAEQGKKLGAPREIELQTLGFRASKRQRVLCISLVESNLSPSVSLVTI